MIDCRPAGGTDEAGRAALGDLLCFFLRPVRHAQSKKMSAASETPVQPMPNGSDLSDLRSDP